ncbi:hypothetical protein C8A01DRAFT_13263 [Parachaetomium inaequale]|uniref:Uncharacterized protein n=1 Tax=Parachaetomium inaequale TaxID=2588326 RepID=A0AAN6PNN6_9PEZI|nr:hypothetical protein C8A01DRAFT_13263 [Parachaetomium inaequale]
MAAMAKPLDSPLPSLPPKFAGPPLRSIPRRPVAAPVTSIPALAPTSSPALASPDPEPSPVGSFSSLFSAYSNHTADSPPSPSVSSPRDILNSKSAYSVVSPNLDAQRSGAQPGAPARDLPRLPSDQNAQKQESQTPEGDRKELPPPPPLKDAQRSIPRPQTPPSLQTQIAPPSTSTKTGSPLGNGSPQQEELWRRRSLRADKSLAVPDLKLVSSNGSTAASAQNTSQGGPSSLFSQPFPLPPRTNPETLEPATRQRAPPRSANGGLPGRNIRPVLGEGTDPQGGASMGQEASRIKEKLENARRRGSREESKSKSQEAQVSQAAATLSPPTSATVSPLSAARLPTPEYGANDVKSPLPDRVVSPMSPASSPDLPGETKPITRKAVGALEAQLRHAKSGQSLAPGPINTGLGVRSPMGLPTSPRPDVNQGPKQTHQKQYIPYSPPADRTEGPTPAQFPAPSSRVGEDQRPLPAAPHQEPSPTTSPQPTTQQNLWAQSPTRDPILRTISETGSVETVKPQQQQHQHQPTPSLILHHPTPSAPITQALPLREPDASTDSEESSTTTTNPGAALFPRGWYTPPTADNNNDNADDATATAAIPDARPLTARHYACLTGHRYMTANRQRTNPVACRTCGHKDRNAECYICSACALNVCAGCVGVLRRCRGDLDAVLGPGGRYERVVRGGGGGGGGVGGGGGGVGGGGWGG